MVLSKKYILRLIGGWAIFGGVSLWLLFSFIGGMAAFFMLLTAASWSIFPLFHFIAAALAARKLGHDPSFSFSVIFFSCVFLILFILLASGLFNYV